jgi:hypothetical protein
VSRTKRIQDVIAMAVPDGWDPADADDRARLVEVLDQFAEQTAAAQYTDLSPSRRPIALAFEPTEWLITQRPDEVERFQPAHDCEVCRAGNGRAREFLAEHPETWVALGNLTYTEVWAQ